MITELLPSIYYRTLFLLLTHNARSWNYLKVTGEENAKEKADVEKADVDTLDTESGMFVDLNACTNLLCFKRCHS